MKALVIKVENILIFIGYTAGMVLLLENMAKIIYRWHPVGINILLFSAFFWVLTFISRKFVFDNHLEKMRFIQKARLELIYFVFCHTFIILLVTTVLKYTPVGYKVGITNFQSYSYFLNYFSNQFITMFLVHIVSVFLFIWFLTFTSRLIVRYFLETENYYTGSIKQNQFRQSVVFGVLLALSLGVLNIQVVWEAVTILNIKTSGYLKSNFHWVVDYILASPIVYYAYVSIKGSTLVEHFSLYRKIV